MFRAWAIAGLVVGILPAEVEAQRNCRKGKPCGETCIAANKTCRVGGGTTTSGGGSVTRPTPPLSLPAAAPHADPPRSAPVAQPGAAPSRPSTLMSMPDSVIGSIAPFVGSKADSVYFRRPCAAASDLAVGNRRYFMTADLAKAAGFRPSRIRECQ